MAEFRRTGIGWEINKLRRHFNEWWETVTRFSSANTTYDPLPLWLSELLTGIAWAMLLVFLAWLGLKLYRLGRNYWLERQRRIMAVGTIITPQKGVAELLGKAELNLQQGDYAAACRYLYLALLQLLHDRDILPQEASRTDGEYRLYLRQKRLQPLTDFLTIINLHERLHFSNSSTSEQEFIDCKNAFDRVVSQL
ncbi:MAG: hypothetical protein RMK91_07655 [Pseudanabaenaceae cyanobacterium SKYGB_i_bin29]|nr:hypothetical protein [Pseudanabaenaceae cyanobacterium SKYG29]MDW8421728.1 hypothetical protein [Pseudanabaenaceae cyanobacterium SKYGB_i_bin29]